MKQHFIKVCVLSGLAMPLFSVSLMAAGSPGSIVAQQQQVQGTVVDKTGEPIIGVTVQVAGQPGATVTDIDGPSLPLCGILAEVKDTRYKT